MSAAFIPAENGPCIAMMCEPGKPRDAHFCITPTLGSTRGYSRSAKFSTAVYASSSLLPVVSSTFPGCLLSHATAASVSGTVSPSPCRSAGRSSRSYRAPVFAHAVRRLSVTSAA